MTTILGGLIFGASRGSVHHAAIPWGVMTIVLGLRWIRSGWPSARPHRRRQGHGPHGVDRFHPRCSAPALAVPPVRGQHGLDRAYWGTGVGDLSRAPGATERLCRMLLLVAASLHGDLRRAFAGTFVSPARAGRAAGRAALYRSLETGGANGRSLAKTLVSHQLYPLPTCAPRDPVPPP
jgi:hypothetical protein